MVAQGQEQRTTPLLAPRYRATTLGGTALIFLYAFETMATALALAEELDAAVEAAATTLAERQEAELVELAADLRALGVHMQHHFGV